MALYVGQAEANLDDKGRLTIPKKFRKLMSVDGDERACVWVVPGGSDCDFILMDDEAGTRWAESLSAGSVGTGGKPAKRRMLLELSERVEVDNTGRALIPASFLESLGIKDREFHIGGCGGYLAAYGRDKWAAHRSVSELQPVGELWDEFGGAGREARASDNA